MKEKISAFFNCIEFKHQVYFITNHINTVIQKKNKTYRGETVISSSEATKSPCSIASFHEFTGHI